jgi:hypothetical protein
MLLFFLLACSACPASNPFSNDTPVTPTPDTGLSGVQLGEIVMAGAIGPGNVPQNARDSFTTEDRVIYVVASGELIEAGTTLFARWYRDGEPFEDTPQLTADRQYTNTYVEFHISPASNAQFRPGSYAVELYINGRPGPRKEFTIE